MKDRSMLAEYILVAMLAITANADCTAFSSLDPNVGAFIPDGQTSTVNLKAVTCTVKCVGSTGTVIKQDGNAVCLTAAVSGNDPKPPSV